jgi:hypothetical protein
LGERRSIAAIGEILAPNRGRGGLHRGVPRRRRSLIRQGFKKRPPRDRMAAEMRRKPWRIKATKPKPFDRFIDHLAGLGAGPARCNQSRIAADVGVNVRTVQGWIIRLVARGAVRKLDSRGGKGRGVLIEIDQNEIARLQPVARRQTMIGFPNPFPDQDQDQDQDLHPAAPLALRAWRSASRLESKSRKSPPTQAERLAMFRRTTRSPDSTKRVSGYLGGVRYAAWAQGCEWPHSVSVVEIAARFAGGIGKATVRDAYLRSAIVRLEHEKPPGSWTALRTWLAPDEVARWYAHWSLRHEPQSRSNHPAEPQQRAGAPVARGAARGAQDAAGASGVRTRSQDRQPPAQLALVLPPWARRFAEIPLRASGLKQIPVQLNPSQIASQIPVNSMPGTVPGGPPDGGLDMQDSVSAELVHGTYTNVGNETDRRERRESDDPHRCAAESGRREGGGGER